MTSLVVSDHIKASAAELPARRRRPPCPVDPACTVDHLKGKKTNAQQRRRQRRAANRG